MTMAERGDVWDDMRREIREQYAYLYTAEESDGSAGEDYAE